MKSRSRIIVIASAAIIGLAALAALQLTPVTDRLREQPFRTTLPTAQPAHLPTASAAAPSARQSATAVPSSSSTQTINLAVPFTPQAPHANWEQPYQDACEEAAVLMVERFWRHASINPEQADQELLQMVNFQEKNFGFYKDSNTAETARWAEKYYPHLAAETLYNVTADDITSALARGHPVIVLVDGRRLGNPFYTQPGPDKHALVIKGTTGSSFITNDPGTRRGADFVYPQEKLLDAMIDYDGAAPGTRGKAMLLLTPRAS